MGMPITVEIADASARPADIGVVFEYFTIVDHTFSTYKTDSEISRINRGEIKITDASAAVQRVFKLSEETRITTNGYFNIRRGNQYDPSGLVKGWAVRNAAELLERRGFGNFSIDAGGDLQVKGLNGESQPWRIGIRNPLRPDQIIKVVRLLDRGIATSGTYLRGQHIYNPHRPDDPLLDVVSITVIGPDVYEADRFATAAFAMGNDGINFIAGLSGFAGYQVDRNGLATMTPGFENYVERVNERTTA